MQGKELTIPESTQVGMFNPEEQLDMAIRAAKALSRVIAGKKKPVIINGETFLEFEDWLTLGRFDNVTVQTFDAEPVEINGVKGAKAKAHLINMLTGEIIGGAEAYCMRDEENWGTQPKYEWVGEGNSRHRVKVSDEIVPWFQLASMAQTRAGSKALRNKEAWIAVLAGYKTTPAEEMTDDTASPAVKERRTVENEQHWCKEHNTAFFKKGKMKSYAHPIGDTGKWCYESKTNEVQEAMDTRGEFDKATSEPSPEPPGEEKKPAQKESKGNLPSHINLTWLEKALAKLEEADPKGWSEDNLLSYMTKTYQTSGNSVMDNATELEEGKAKHFTKLIQEALEKREIDIEL